VGNNTHTQIDAHIQSFSDYTGEPKVADIIAKAPWVDVKAFCVGDGVNEDGVGWAAFIAAPGVHLVRPGNYFIYGVIVTYTSYCIINDNQIYPKTHGGTEQRVVRAFYDDLGAFRCGVADLTMMDDEMGFGDSLPGLDWWGNDANIGIGSLAFGRNGAAYGYLSAAFGHDCVAFGVASIAAGAGSSTGLYDTADGYCSIAMGKNVQALGEKSTAFGEGTRALSRNSFTAGYSAIAGPGLITHPNGVISEGVGATSIGRETEAYGEGAVALGKYIRSYNGAVTIGSGINSGSPMLNSIPGSIGFGANSYLPTVTYMPGLGIDGEYGYTRHRGKTQYVDGHNADQILAEINAGISNGGGGGYGNLIFSTRIAGAMTPVVQIDAGATSGNKSFLPITDGGTRLGAASLRFDVLFASTGTINTSDANEKQQIEDLSEAEKRVAVKIKGSIKKFKFNDAVAAKGDNARIHVGVIAQEVAEMFASEGLDANQYALFCYDEWPEKPETKDAEGNIVQLYKAAGSRYGIRYEELLAFVISAM
jgi:hypothetical protein